MKQKTYSLDKLNEISQGDESFVNDMLVTFVENVSEDVRKLEWSKAVEGWRTVGELAHKMVTRFAYLDAQNMQQLAADIEKSVLNENDLTAIDEKTEKLISGSSALLNELKNDFDFLNTN